MLVFSAENEPQHTSHEILYLNRSVVHTDSAPKTRLVSAPVQHSSRKFQIWHSVSTRQTTHIFIKNFQFLGRTFSTFGILGCRLGATTARDSTPNLVN